MSTQDAGPGQDGGAVAPGLSPGPCSPKELAFAAAVAAGASATQAAKDAGYAAGSAHVTGSRLIRRAKVAAEIERLRALAVAHVERETGITRERVIAELGTFGFIDPAGMFDDQGRMLPLPQMPEAVRRAIASVEYEETFDEARGADGELTLIKTRTAKVKFWDKRSGLELIAKLQGYLKDRVEHEHRGGIMLRWADEA